MCKITHLPDLEMQQPRPASKVHTPTPRLGTRERQNEVKSGRGRAAPNPPAWLLSPREEINPKAKPQRPAKATDTKYDKGVERAQRLSPTGVYPTKRRSTRSPEIESCLRLLLGYTP